MRRLLAIACVAGISAAAPAFAANNLDLSTVHCKDFLGAGKDNIAVIITWLDGYYKTEDDPPVIDFDSFEKNSGDLASYCKDNPDSGLITAADQTLGKKKKK
jgi:acid stress chaperone HdeB